MTIGAPAQMLGYVHRFEAADQVSNLAQMIGINPVSPTKRQANAVKTQRIDGAKALQRLQPRAAAEIVLGMDFQEANRRARRFDLGDVGRAQAYSGGKGLGHE